MDFVRTQDGDIEISRHPLVISAPCFEGVCLTVPGLSLVMEPEAAVKLAQLLLTEALACGIAEAV